MNSAIANMANHEDSASTARQGVLEFLLSQSMSKPAFSQKTKEEQTAHFIRTQCYKLIKDVALQNELFGEPASITQAHYEQLNAFLEYLETSVRMTPELSEATDIEEALVMMFDRRELNFPPQLAQRANDLYMRWSLAKWGDWSTGDRMTDDDGMNELVARTAAAGVTKEDAHGDAVMGALEDDFANALMVKDFGSEQPDAAQMGGTAITTSTLRLPPIAQQARIPQQRARPATSTQNGVSAENPFYDPSMDLLSAAGYFHEGLMEAQATVKHLLTTAPAAEIATMRITNTNTFTRMFQHFIFMNQLLRFKRQGWDLRGWPEEFGQAVWQPLGEVVDGLKRIEGWQGCPWVGAVAREAKLAKNGIGWVMVEKGKMEKTRTKDEEMEEESEEE